MTANLNEVARGDEVLDVPLERSALVARHLQGLEEFPHTGGMVHAVTHEREHLITRKHRFLGYQNYLQVADVGTRRTGVNEVAERVEERVGIVVEQKRIECEAGRRRAMDRSLIRDRSGSVSRAVDAVSAGARQRDRRSDAAEQFRSGEREFLIAAALPFTDDLYGRLSGRHDAGGPRRVRGLRQR